MNILNTLNSRRRAGAWRTFSCLALAWATGSMYGPDASAEAGALTPAASVRIRLYDEVRIRSPLLTLGDVAGITTRDLSTIQRLVAMPLGSAPRSGEGRTLARERVQEWVQRHSGLAESAIAWSGAEEVLVTRPSLWIDGERLSAAAEQSLRATVAREVLSVQLELARAPHDIEVPAGEVLIKPRPLPATTRLGQRVTVWVDLWVEGRFARVVPVTFDVTPASVTPSYLARSEAPLTPTSERVTARSADAVAGLPLVAALVPASTIPAYSRAPNGAAAPLVSRGQWATLKYVDGGVELEARVQAMQDGHQGQAIRVRLGAAKDLLMATVVAPGAVEMMR